MSPASLQRHPAPSGSRRGWRLFRFFARWTLILLGFLLLSAILLGWYLNQVGLPEPVKQRLVARLREYGWDVQFSRLRLRWYRGIVAEHLQLQRTNGAAGPRIFIEQAECPVSHAALKHWEFKPTAVQLFQLRLIWPLAATNPPARTFVLNRLGGELLFRTSDEWELRTLKADYRGIRLKISGTLTNCTAIRDWRFARRSRAAGEPDQIEEWLNRIERLADQIHLAPIPEIDLVVHGDARDFQNLQVGLRLAAPAGESAWGRAAPVMVTASLQAHRRPNGPRQAQLEMAAGGIETPWWGANALRLKLQFEPSWTQLLSTNVAAEAELDAVHSPWGQAERVRLSVQSTANATNAASRQTTIKATLGAASTGRGSATNALLTVTAVQPLTNWLPATCSASLHLDRIHSHWAEVAEADLAVEGFIPHTNQLFRTNLLWTDRLAGTPLHLTTTLSNLIMPSLTVSKGTVQAQWQSPVLHVDLGAAVANGRWDSQSRLNTGSRRLNYAVTNTIDPKLLIPLFWSNAPAWLADLNYGLPPRLLAEGQCVLPAWTNRPSDWGAAVLPTMTAAGRLEANAVTYRGIAAQALYAGIALTNSALSLKGARLERPEGVLLVDTTLDTRTLDFATRLDSRVDPKLIRPLLATNRPVGAFDLVQFSSPPQIQAELRGRLGNWEGLDAQARLGITNFTIRGERIKDAAATAHYTNQFISILTPLLQREGERGSADGIGIDLVRKRIHLTNVVGNLNPYAVVRAINPKTARALSNYVYAAPPQVRLSGIVGLVGKDNAEDLRFHVDGKNFRWKMFRLPELAGEVHVLGQTAAITNAHGRFYGGFISGQAFFNWAGTNGTDFAFSTTVTQADLRELMTDISSLSNRLEGAFGGHLTITSGNDLDDDSWQGFGHVELKNGLIWDFPFFGYFSKALNSFIPGLGNSRAKEGAADFGITNSVIYTKDLDIRATAMRMHFDGRFGFDESVSGRMEAELLRDMPALGGLVSKVLWPVTKLFEYKVTGKWSDPKAEPVYLLPKALMMPFSPIRTLKDLFSPGDSRRPAPTSNPP